MDPTPQEQPQAADSGFNQGDVVITGISGLFPKCNNVTEFADKLLAKENLISSDRPRWDFNHPEVSKFIGKVPGLEKFDAQFFMVHYRLSNSMDAMTKKLMEHAYQAIFDAGVNPAELSGTKLGVFVGTGMSETEKVCSYANIGLGIVGCNRAMFSNRISYMLNAKGPSMTIDGHDSGSMIALEKAYDSILHGECDSAIVGGSCIHLHPQNFVHYGRLVRLNPDGKMKCYAKDADGQSLSEAISVIFLQKYRDAKRVYAKVCHAKSLYIPFGDEVHGQSYSHYRPVDLTTRFLTDFYQEARVAPAKVQYVEGFGAAIPEADAAELEAFDRVFCEGQRRQDALYVGSVMSNMGYSDATTGLAALTKVCLGFHEGRMPASLHCESPNDDVAGVRAGRLRVAADHLPVRSSYVGMNNFSLTGINAHALLKGHYKPQDITQYKSDIPYLVTVSSRQDSGVKNILEDLNKQPINPEEIALFHNIHKMRVSKHMARGYSVLSTNEANETVSLCQAEGTYDGTKRPLWFVYSGMGSQWPGMGTQLMRIPVFAEAIHKCHKILKPKGVDLINILTTEDKTIFDNILHSFVGIAAVQIGLTDVLRAIKLVPDNIIGHSVGELGCAYADGCFTAEEMILSAYSRGLVSLQTPFIKGSMAAVGLGYQQIIKLIPSEIEVACHNGPESSTISGPADIMKSFVAELTAQGIFAKEVPCSNIAYHSRYIKDAGPGLLKYLSEVIKEPKLRSKKWVSTSIPRDRWQQPISKSSSAEYHTNNLLSPVLFEETSAMIPANAVLIEVAPHSLLQAILKRSLPTSCTNIPLTRRGHQDNVVMLLEAIGKIFMAGFDVNLSGLYPKVEFPVSTKTRNISHLVEWVHTEKWSMPLYKKANRKHAAAAEFSVSYHDDESKYLMGHVVDGDILYPAGALLVSVWDTLAMSRNVPRKQLTVQFTDVTFCVHAKLMSTVPLRLNVELHRGTGRFEVTNDNVVLATGYIAAEDKTVQEIAMNNDKTKITTDDIYRALYEKHYEYKGEFRNILTINKSFTHAEVHWTGNWVTLLDSFFQIQLLRRDDTSCVHLHQIHNVIIDTKVHEEYANKKVLDALVCEEKNLTRCAGITMEKIQFVKRPLQQRGTVVLKSSKFVPYFQKDGADIARTLNVFLQIVSENVDTSILKVLEISDSKIDSITAAANEVLDNLPNQKISLQIISKEDILNPKYKTDVPNLILINNRLINGKVTEDLYHALPRGVLIIILEEVSPPSSSYRAISSAITSRGRMVLAKWRPTDNKPTIVVNVTSQKDLLLLYAERQKMKANEKMVVLTVYPAFNGLKDLIKKYRKDSQRNDISLAIVDMKTFQNLQGKQLPDFELAFNVLQKGTWGCEVFLPKEPTKQEQQNVSLRSFTDGGLESLQWVQIPEIRSKGIEVQVWYAGLNYLDAKRVTGEAWVAPDVVEHTIGMDYSGMTKTGERVMGVVPCGAAATRVIAEPSLLWPVPTHWSLEDAATVPLAYAHAFYCLAIQCKLTAGMCILVHGASGGLGQAVINIALAHKCRVFATVSDVKKKRFLRKLYPEIPETHIGNSRDSTFMEMVLNVTRGKGCDLVISCVKGNLANVSLDCRADLGLMLDTHHVHTRESFSIGMHCLTRARSYIMTDFASILNESNHEEMAMIQRMLAEGISRGYVRPLTRVTFDWREAARGLRLLAGSRHRGRVLLNMRGPPPDTLPRISCAPSGSHLIVSADEDSMLTIKLAELLVMRGAKNITINHHNGLVKGDGHVQMKLRSWSKAGVNVKICIEKWTTKEQVSTVLDGLQKTGSVEGIFVVAFNPENKIEDDVVSILATLDELSRKMCPHLKYFSMITESMDAAQEVFVRRTQRGLPAVMLKLSNIEKFDGSRNNTPAMSSKSVLEAVEVALQTPDAVTLASSKPTPKTTILEELAKIPRVMIPSKLNEHLTLNQLGIDVDGAMQLSEVLERKFKIMVNENDVPNLTIAELKSMQERLDSTKDEVITGLKTFLSTLDPDELLATTPVVPLQTLGQNSTRRQDEFDDSHSYMVLIPGMEGSHMKFIHLAQRLKLPALVLQPGMDYPNESIVEMAERLTQLMIKSVKPEVKFNLLGYSSGALVAMEMARILEEKGFEGTVFCVDAEPGSFASVLESWLEVSKGEDFLQNSIIEYMFSLLVGEQSEVLASKLRELTNWKDKVDVCLKALNGRVAFTNQYSRCLIETAYGRIQQVRKYNPDTLKKNPLKSQVVLMRSRCKFAEGNDIQKYTKKELITYDLETDHARALEDLRCTNAVNRHLDQNVLEEFEKSNLCTTYLFNATVFFDFTDELDEDADEED